MLLHGNLPKYINMTSLEHSLPPGKCQIYNMTTNLEPDNVFFFLQISWRWSPALMSRSSTSLLWRERRLSSPVPSTPWGTLRSVKYSATCKIVIYIASSAEWNVKVAYSTFSFNFNDLNNCTISSKLKFKRSLLYIPH